VREQWNLVRQTDGLNLLVVWKHTEGSGESFA
jgi:hypothetical protein